MKIRVARTSRSIIIWLTETGERFEPLHKIRFGAESRGPMNIKTAAFVLAASTIAATPALAADVYTPAPAPAAPYTQEEISSAIDVAFGVALTSRYISRGVDQTDGPALQGYIEPSIGIFYGGVWASTMGRSFSGQDAEFDLYLGVRPTFGDLALDFGYVRYIYTPGGDCCGEIYGKATYAFTEQFSAGGELYFDPEASTTYGVLNAAVALPYDFSLSGGIGTYFTGEADWNVGLSYTFAETVTVDARYHDASFGPARFVASIALDSTFSKIFNRR